MQGAAKSSDCLPPRLPSASSRDQQGRPTDRRRPTMRLQLPLHVLRGPTTAVNSRLCGGQQRRTAFCLSASSVRPLARQRVPKRPTNSLYVRIQTVWHVPLTRLSVIQLMLFCCRHCRLPRPWRTAGTRRYDGKPLHERSTAARRKTQAHFRPLA